MPTTIEALRAHRMFAQIPDDCMAPLATAAQLTHYPNDSDVAINTMGMGLCVLTHGRLLMRSSTTAFQLELNSPDAFSTPVALALPDIHCTATAVSCIVFIPLAALQSALATWAPLAVLFPFALPTEPINLEGGDNPSPLDMPIESLVHRAPIGVPAHTSIRDAASLMQQQGISSVLLLDGDTLVGLLTDRDLRNRVIIPGLDIDNPVSEVATINPLTLDVRSTVLDAQLLMAKHNIHHVPITRRGAPMGMVSATDMAVLQRTSAVHLAADIRKQDSPEALAELSHAIHPLQLQLAASGASAYSTGHMVTAITDALTVRLIELAQVALGPAPVDFLWVAAGSQARSEQTAKSDQDNCMVLDDKYDATFHGSYFAELSRRVCDGLAACGYIHCPGEMMAMTDQWRQPLHRWRQYFEQWIYQPDPKALMLTCVFFDLRAIHGTNHLLTQLRDDVLQRTRGNSLFLAHMVGNALKRAPPLNLLGNLSTSRHGGVAKGLDMKYAGITPIVDLARVYALAGGLDAVNTTDRLRQSAQSSEISEGSARDLHQALAFLSGLRIAHQAAQMRRGEPPDNILDVDQLSNLDRTHLRHTFQIVQTLQEVLRQRYQTSRF